MIHILIHLIFTAATKRQRTSTTDKTFLDGEVNSLDIIDVVNKSLAKLDKDSQCGGILDNTPLSSNIVKCAPQSDATNGTADNKESPPFHQEASPLVESSPSYIQIVDLGTKVDHIDSSNNYESDQLERLIDQGQVHDLCEQLKDKDDNVVLMGLNRLEAVLRMAETSSDSLQLGRVVQIATEGGGLAASEKLQSHENRTIRERVSRIFEM